MDLQQQQKLDNSKLSICVEIPSSIISVVLVLSSSLKSTDKSNILFTNKEQSTFHSHDN